MTMEQKSYVLEQISRELKQRVERLQSCDIKELSQIFRLLNETVQEYCTYRTIFEKYVNDENEENKKA